MVNILKSAWAAAASFYQIKMGLLRPSQAGGVDVVIYDYKVPLYDTLGYAMEMELPVLQTYPPVLYDRIELMEEVIEGELTEKLSFRQIEVVRSGNWWSEWKTCSACAEAVSESPVSAELAYEATYDFSIEDGPLSWEHVSPLLNVNEEKDLRIVGSSSTSLTPEQEVGQVWCQVMIFWFDARYQNCTLQPGKHQSPQCGQPSKLYHGDAPYRASMIPIRATLSYGKANCQC